MHRFKYINNEFVDKFLAGELLFRSLSYFINYERGDSRSDPLDGTRMHRPENGLVINTVVPSRSTFIYHGGSMVASVKNPDDIFVMCLSNRLSGKLAKKFKVNKCIEISCMSQFEGRILDAIKGEYSETRLFGRNVRYYELREEMGIDWSSPEHVLFRKRTEYYSEEYEYRFAFGKNESLSFDTGASNMELKLYHPNHQKPEAPEPMLGPFPKRTISIGDIHRLCRVHSL